jgi:hypothetical protein
MTTAPEKLSGRERREQIDRIVADCRQKARKIVESWQLTNPDLKVVEGCAYLRLSTDDVEFPPSCATQFPEYCATRFP